MKHCALCWLDAFHASVSACGRPGLNIYVIIVVVIFVGIGTLAGLLCSRVKFEIIG